MQWYGRPVFRARTGRNHQTKTTTRKQVAYTPRNLTADLIIAGPACLEPVFREWIDAYAQVAPRVVMAYQCESRANALKLRYQGQAEMDADVVILETRANEDELAAGLAQQERWFCQECGQRWWVEEECFRCTNPPCRHTDLARFHTATVVAQIGLRALLKHDQQTTPHTAPETPDGTGTDQKSQI